MNPYKRTALLVSVLWLLAAYAAAWRCSAATAGSRTTACAGARIEVMTTDLFDCPARTQGAPARGEAAFLSLASASGERPGLASRVIVEVNRERGKRGLNALRESAELDRAAALRARELVRSFSHTRPDGTRWTTVTRSALGENIARGQRTADKVMAAWMSSASHRANILRPGFRSVGVCAYIHNSIVYWVQLFGR